MGILVAVGFGVAALLCLIVLGVAVATWANQWIAQFGLLVTTIGAAVAFVLLAFIAFLAAFLED